MVLYISNRIETAGNLDFYGGGDAAFIFSLPRIREQNQKIRPILDGFFMFDGLKKVAVVPIGRGIRPRQSKTRQPLVEKRITGSPDFDRSGCPKTTKTRRKPRVLWCRQRDLNSRPDDYKSTALPTELCRPDEKLYIRFGK